MRPAVVLVFAAACGSSSPPSSHPAATPAPVELPPLRDPALQSMAFMAGAWQADDGTIEVWTPAGDALFGVTFVGSAFEAAIVSVDEGAIVYHAMPGGRPAVSFKLDETGRFVNAEHDEPQVIHYARSGDTLDVTVSQLDGSKAIATHFKRVEHPAAPVLADADRQFAADTEAKGSAGWVAWFAPDGVMGRRKGNVEGAEAITAAMAPLLDDPAKKLLWEPVASGLAPTGDVGFTVGEATITVDGAIKSYTAYVTIWQKQPDGTWRVRFDTGEEDTTRPL
jgi:ketosteroid isomerase-like protein